MPLRYKIVNKKKLATTLFIDILGFLLIKPFTLLRRKKGIKRDSIKKILVVRTAYIGDVVMTTPVLKPLREMFPEAKISFLTGRKEAEILKNNPFIDEILLYDAFWFYPSSIGKGMSEYFKTIRRLRKEQFDLAIDLRGDIRNILFILFFSRAYHRVSYGVGGGSYFLTKVVPFKKIKHKIAYHLDILNFLGAKINTARPEIYLSSSEEEFKRVVFRVNGISDNDLVIGVHPGGRKKLKCWYPEGYVTLISHLIREFGAKIVITGSITEMKLAEKISSAVREKTISLCGKTTLRELASMIKSFDLFICGDCAPMHIASTLGTPVVAIFGPSKSWETGPYGNFRLIEKNFPCRLYCDENLCHHRPYHECMKTITPEDIYNAAIDLIKTKNKGSGLNI